jgi:exopolysaccharide biosynthesis polyprenyl glycosylphosphotransferase
LIYFPVRRVQDSYLLTLTSPFFQERNAMSFLGVETPRLFAGSDANSAVNSGAEHEVSIRNRFERVLTGIEVFADWLTIVIAVNGGYALYHYLNLGKRAHYSISTLTYVSSAMAVLFVILLDRDGAYRPGNSLLRIRETERSLRVSAQGFLLILPVTFFASYLLSRWVFLIAMLFVPLLQVIQKQLIFVAVGALRARNVDVRRVLIYGAGASGRRVLSALLRSPKLGLTPVALIDDDPVLEGQKVHEYAYRRGQSVGVISGPVTEELLRNYGCELLIIAIPNLGREQFSGAAAAAQSAGVRLAYVAGEAVAAGYWTEYADIDGILLNVFGRPANRWQYDAAKRLFDSFAATALIVCFAPVWMLLAILIRMDSPGPVLFRQSRVGKNNKQFTLYKFRSMHVDAPRYQISPTEADDPRITRMGRFLRRSSLDEIPQLINVVKGEMALVGPRPEMPFIVEQYSAAHRLRLRVVPGITGLWQLSADRAFQIHENIQYDFYYIRNRSFFMDFAILLHTLVFAMNGI